MKTEKVLEFTYQMRKFYEGYLMEKEDADFLKNETELKKLREMYSCIFEDYKAINTMINECEQEIAYAAAKSSGKKNEKKRTTAAKKVLKNAQKTNNEVLCGYKKLDDGKIVVCDGYVLYMGEEIIGIEETKYPDKYMDISRVFPQYNADENVFSLDLSTITSRLKIAKVEFKEHKRKFRRIWDATENSYVMFTNNDNQDVYFDSEQVVTACDMIGGDNYTIQIGKLYAPAIVRCKENENICIVMPFKK